MGDKKPPYCYCCSFKTDDLKIVPPPDNSGTDIWMCELCRDSAAKDMYFYPEQYKGQYYAIKVIANMSNKILAEVRAKSAPPPPAECPDCKNEKDKTNLALKSLRRAFRIMDNTKHVDWCQGFGCDYCHFLTTMRAIPTVSSVDPGPWRE